MQLREGDLNAWVQRLLASLDAGGGRDGHQVPPRYPPAQTSGWGTWPDTWRVVFLGRPVAPVFPRDFESRPPNPPRLPPPPTDLHTYILAPATRSLVEGDAFASAFAFAFWTRPPSLSPPRSPAASTSPLISPASLRNPWAAGRLDQLSHGKCLPESSTCRSPHPAAPNPRDPPRFLHLCAACRLRSPADPLTMMADVVNSAKGAATSSTYHTDHGDVAISTGRSSPPDWVSEAQGTRYVNQYAYIHALRQLLPSS